VGWYSGRRRAVRCGCDPVPDQAARRRWTFAAMSARHAMLKEPLIRCALRVMTACPPRSVHRIPVLRIRSQTSFTAASPAPRHDTSRRPHVLRYRSAPCGVRYGGAGSGGSPGHATRSSARARCAAGVTSPTEAPRREGHDRAGRREGQGPPRRVQRCACRCDDGTLRVVNFEPAAITPPNRRTLCFMHLLLAFIRQAARPRGFLQGPILWRQHNRRGSGRASTP
jgi:hypothetical protein